MGQVLSDAVTGLARVWKSLLWPAVLVSIPVAVATVFAFVSTGANEFLELVLTTPERLQTLSDDVFFELARPFYVAVGLATLIQMLAGVFLALVSHRAVALELIDDQPPPSSKVVGQALRMYPRAVAMAVIALLVIGMLAGMGIFVWSVPLATVGTPNPTSALVAVLLFFVVLAPAAWAAISMSMATSVVALEKGTVVGSIRRSADLVRGRWWSTAGFLLLVGLLGGVAVQLIQLVALPLLAFGDAGALVAVGAGVGVLAQGIILGALAVMFTHWYIDLRSRREHLLSEDLA